MHEQCRSLTSNIFSSTFCYIFQQSTWQVLHTHTHDIPFFFHPSSHAIWQRKKTLRCVTAGYRMAQQKKLMEKWKKELVEKKQNSLYYIEGLYLNTHIVTTCSYCIGGTHNWQIFLGHPVQYIVCHHVLVVPVTKTRSLMYVADTFFFLSWEGGKFFVWRSCLPGGVLAEWGGEGTSVQVW